MSDNKLTIKKHMNNIINFIKNNNIDIIKKNLINIIFNNKYCDKVYGRGFYAVVFEQGINNKFIFTIKNKSLSQKIKIKFPIIIKEQNVNNDIINNILYIYGTNTIMTESIILMYIRKLWYKTVHLPLILTFSTCNGNIINKICSIKYGLSKKISLNINNKFYNDFEMWDKNFIYKPVFDSYINNLFDLLLYIKYLRNIDGTITLPNGIKCYIYELVDYISISYLVTYHLLNLNNVFPSDLSLNNIFIHWFNKTSYYNFTNIQNTQEIIYKINNKYYKIKTLGFVIILGDLGTSIIKIKKNTFIIGHSYNFTYNYDLIPLLINNFNNYNLLMLFYNLLDYCTLNDFNNTIIYNILSLSPYKDYPFVIHEYNIEYVKKCKTIPELLSYYDKKYSVNKYEKTESNIFIDIKKYIN